MPTEITTTVKGHSHRRQIVRDGETLSRLSVRDCLIWLVGTQVRMGGVGGVRTERQHRMKGHSRRLMEDTVEYMTGLGQDVSMLFGISDFYDKVGFVPCLPEHEAHIATRDAERAAEGAGSYTTRPVRPDDHPFIVALYNEDNRHRAAALVRDEEHFAGFRKGSSYHTRAAAILFEGEGGRRLAYAVYDDNQAEVRVTEVNATDRAAFWSILYEFAKMAVERRCGHIELHMAADHPFLRFARRYGCRLQTDFPRMGGGMMRLLNQDALFEKLHPALERRLARSAFADRPVTLGLETDLGHTELRFNGGTATDSAASALVKLGQGKLTQLLVGYRAADDVLGDPDVEAQGDAEALLKVLFEGQRPYVWQADRF